MKELWAIKSPDGEIHYQTITETAEDALLNMKDILMDNGFYGVSFEGMHVEGFRAVRVRVEEIEGNESDDSKEKGGE